MKVAAHEHRLLVTEADQDSQKRPLRCEHRRLASVEFLTRLKELGAEVVIHDPYVPGYQGDVLEMTQECDAAVVMVGHGVYRELDWEQMPVKMVVDGRHLLLPPCTTRDGAIVALGKDIPGEQLSKFY